MCQNTTTRVYGAWIKKTLCFIFNEHITRCTVVITSLLDRDKPLEAPASLKQVYCETGLSKLMTTKYVMVIFRYVYMNA